MRARNASMTELRPIITRLSAFLNRTTTRSAQQTNLEVLGLGAGRSLTAPVGAPQPR
jgi:hypothetical protein